MASEAASHLLSVVPDPEPMWAYDALLELLSEDEEALARFSRACGQYVIFPDGQVLAFRSALARRDHRYRYEHVEAALYSLALEELPESWAAGRERLRRLQENRSAVGAPTATTAVEDLLVAETVWLREIGLLAEDPPDYDRLREFAAKVWTELRRRGRDFQPEHFSEHVHAVLCAVFPHAPGAAWDETWADGLTTRAIAHVARRVAPGAYPGDSERVARADAEVGAAYAEEDRRRYRRALRKWLEAARDASDGSSPSA